MYRYALLLFAILSSAHSTFCLDNDSLVVLSDLRFHSELEQNSLENFVQDKSGAHLFFLSIDREMTGEKATGYEHRFEELMQNLESKKA